MGSRGQTIIKFTIMNTLLMKSLCVLAMTMLSSAYPAPPAPSAPSAPSAPLEPMGRFTRDQMASADSSYSAAPVGRVKIQVYRGPSKGEGYDVFAPWGYYNTQPADLAKHR